MFKKLLMIGLLASSLFSVEETECVPLDKSMNALRLNLTIYSDKVNDGTFDYHFFDSKIYGSTKVNFYQNKKSKDLILLSEKYVNGYKTYPMQYIHNKVKFDLVCINKDLIKRLK